MIRIFLLFLSLSRIISHPSGRSFISAGSCKSSKPPFRYILIASSPYTSLFVITLATTGSIPYFSPIALKSALLLIIDHFDFIIYLSKIACSSDVLAIFPISYVLRPLHFYHMTFTYVQSNLIILSNHRT